MSIPITSELLVEEPDLVGLVKEFVQSLPDFMVKIQQAAQNHDWATMLKTVHELKGASGNYGFPLLENMAKLIEFNIKQDQHDNAVHMLNDLENIMGRVIKGV